MSSRPEAGQRVGEYVLETLIGMGGFATVWRAHHHAWSERQVAAKILRDTSQVKLLRDEASCLARLHHPCIAGAVSMDLDHDPPYLLVELHEGRTLREVLRSDKKLAPVRAFAVFAQIVAALAHSHRLGIAHGDLKPENVLIDADWRVKLTDFGLGRVRATEASLLLSGQLDGEEKGLSGTIPYMAPEQRDGSPPDPTSDVFALGILLYELITGTRPQPGDDLREHLTDPPKWLSVWERCFTRRDKRYRDAGEVANALGLDDVKGVDPELPKPPGAGLRAPWTLEEIERAVTREVGIHLAELREIHDDDEGLATRLIAWAEERFVGHKRQIRQARAMVWHLAAEYLGSVPRALADRHRVTVREVNEGIHAVRQGQIDPQIWRGTVERLAPMPHTVRDLLRRGESGRNLQITAATAPWFAALGLLVGGVLMVASGGVALAPGVGLLVGGVPFLVWLGTRMAASESGARRWIRGNLDKLPGADRESKLAFLAMHTELRALSRAARSMRDEMRERDAGSESESERRPRAHRHRHRHRHRAEPTPDGEARYETGPIPTSETFSEDSATVLEPERAPTPEPPAAREPRATISARKVDEIAPKRARPAVKPRRSPALEFEQAVEEDLSRRRPKKRDGEDLPPERLLLS